VLSACIADVIRDKRSLTHYLDRLRLLGVERAQWIAVHSLAILGGEPVEVLLEELDK
jgi:hypothetical protein